MLLLLGTLLTVFKLAGVINWAWWIVLIPFYPWAAGVLLIVAFCVSAAVIEPFVRK